MFEINAVSEENIEWSDEKIIKLQQDDPKIAELTRIIKEKGKNQFNNYVEENGIIFCLKKKTKNYEPQFKKRLVIPESLIPSVLELCHDGIAGAHLGVNKTWEKVATRFFWDTMRSDTLNWIKSCKICAAKKNPPPSREILHSMPQPNMPFERIGIDFLGPLVPSDNGFKYILVITDYCTRWAEAFPTTDMKASTVARILINK